MEVLSPCSRSQDLSLRLERLSERFIRAYLVFKPLIRCNLESYIFFLFLLYLFYIN